MIDRNSDVTDAKKDTSPLVSVGIPVRNGDDFIEEAINSVLNQTYNYFELIISDNNSTDNTKKICKKYVHQDKRIKFLSLSKNIGAAKNFNRVFLSSKGKYFLWLAHDDYLHPTYLEKAVKILEKDESIHLVYSKAIAVDEFGKKVLDYSSNLNLDSESPSERLFNSICISHKLMEVFGVIRASILKKTSLIGKYCASDRVLLAEISLLGKAKRIPEYLFFYRIHSKKSTKVFTTKHTRAQWFDPKLKDKKLFPYWKILLEFYKSIKNSNIRGKERRKCYFFLIIWIRKHIGYLIRDLYLWDKYLE